MKSEATRNFRSSNTKMTSEDSRSSHGWFCCADNALKGGKHEKKAEEGQNLNGD